MSAVENTSLHPAGPGAWGFAELTTCGDCHRPFCLDGHPSTRCGIRRWRSGTVVPMSDAERAKVAGMFRSRRARLQAAQEALGLRLVPLGPADERYCSPRG